MSTSFLKASGIPKLSTKTTAFMMPKIPKPPNLISPKIPNQKTYKSIDFSKILKPPKLPKAKKISIIKRAIKKAKKNVGY